MKLNAWIAFLATIFLTFGTIGTTVYSVWNDLDADQQAVIAALSFKYAGILIVGGIILAVTIGFIVNLMYQWYIAPFHTIADDARIICVSNPSHRVGVHGKSELRELAASINGLADRYQRLKEDVEGRIQEASAALEEEKTTLAALIANLTQGVLVCNIEGRILLYNQRAKDLLEGTLWRSEGTWIGLGRSVYKVLDEDRINHALLNVEHRLQQGETGLMAPFVVTRPDGQQLGVHLVPVLDDDTAIRGFIFTIENITRQASGEHQRHALIRSVIENYRSALTSIRAAVETIRLAPDMDEASREGFLKAIHHGAFTMVGQLDELEEEHADEIQAGWPFQQLLGSDLVAIIERQVRHRLEVKIDTSVPIEPLWLNVDSFALCQCYLFLIERLRMACRAEAFVLKLERRRELAALTLEWSGAVLHPEAFQNWSILNVRAGTGEPSARLFDIVERHRGAIWPLAREVAVRPSLRLVLPVAEVGTVEQEGGGVGTTDHDFDFTLFHAGVAATERGSVPLERLSYTVFDTEATGLKPSGGDEIISLGAVRLINRRILHRETFDCLVDPRRSIPEAAIAIHNITPDMLRGMPVIEDVIPRFHRFVEDTILLGHNVEYDLRFLEIKEPVTGLRFENPYLDTLQLAAFVQPNRHDQSLEALAGRLGVPVTGRHSALGDALTTAEVFLALIPLLNALGVRTFDEAKLASTTTQYASLKY